MVMIKRILAIILIIYFLALVQTSFLLHFGTFTTVLNLVFIFVLIINFLNFPFWQKMLVAAIGGFYLDIFSLSVPFGFFGFYTLSLIIGCFLLRIFLKKYVRISFFQEN
jgi:rod shape-determining protein MreD